MRSGWVEPGRMATTLSRTSDSVQPVCVNGKREVVSPPIESNCALIQSRAGTIPWFPVVGVEQELRVPEATRVWIVCESRLDEIVATTAAMTASTAVTPSAPLPLSRSVELLVLVPVEEAWPPLDAWPPLLPPLPGEASLPETPPIDGVVPPPLLPPGPCSIGMPESLEHA